MGSEGQGRLDREKRSNIALLLSFAKQKIIIDQKIVNRALELENPVRWLMNVLSD